MEKVKIRFNKHHNNSGLDWKIFVGDRMYLARHVSIEVPSVTSMTIENNNEAHWNIVCYGHLIWYDEVCCIKKHPL